MISVSIEDNGETKKLLAFLDKPMPWTEIDQSRLDKIIKRIDKRISEGRYAHSLEQVDDFADQAEDFFYNGHIDQAYALLSKIDDYASKLGNIDKSVVRAYREDFDSILSSQKSIPMRSAPAPVSGDFRTVRGAADEPLNMDALADQEAGNIMAPHDAKTLYPSVNEMLPQSPQLQPDGSVSMVFDNPEVASAIRSAAGTLRLRPEGEGINGREVTQILSKLRKNANRGGIEGDNARAAIIHIEDDLAANHPEVADDIARMRDAYAARMRMLEGQAEGGRTRTRADVPAGNDSQVREARNAYDTPEGTQGRILGQSNRLTTNLGGTADDAMRTIDDLANSGNTQRAIAGNLGSDVQEGLTAGAQAQIGSMRALSAVAKEGKTDDNLAVTELAHALAGLNPAAMVTTKAWAMAWLGRAIGIPEKKAKVLIDMMFSQDPAMTTKAIRLLNSSSSDARKFVGQLQMGIAGGRFGGQIPAAMSSDGEPLPSEDTPAAPTEASPWDEISTPEDAAPAAEDAGAWDEISTPEDNAAPEDGFGNAKDAIQSIYPEAEVTSNIRDPDSELGKLGGYHASSTHAVDVRPIPGMSYEEYIQGIEDAGYSLIEAYDESQKPADKRKARWWGPHWHVVFQ